MDNSNFADRSAGNDLAISYKNNQKLPCKYLTKGIRNMHRTVTALIAPLLLTGAASASGPGENHATGNNFLANSVLTYEVFEASIEHVDLEGCPVDFDADANFCRTTLASDLAHVFVFSYDGAQPLLAVKSYELTDGFLPF